MTYSHGTVTEPYLLGLDSTLPGLELTLKPYDSSKLD